MLEDLVGKLDARQLTTAPASCTSHEVVINELESKISVLESSIKGTILESNEQVHLQKKLQAAITQLTQHATHQSPEPLVQEMKVVFMTELEKVNNTITSVNSEVDNLRSTTQEVSKKFVSAEQIMGLIKDEISLQAKPMQPNTQAAASKPPAPLIDHGLSPHGEILPDAIESEGKEKLTDYLNSFESYETAPSAEERSCSLDLNTSV